MDYSLAKQLKDAEFPQHSIGANYSLEYGNPDKYNFVKYSGLSNVDIAVPNLSELIEACGDGLESIIQRGNGEGDNWEVRSKQKRFNATTLEEAVAKLWLELKNYDN